jgi:Na+/glutamate symporter
MENQYNNFDELNELDDLRQQINDLKNKVDQQGRLNEEGVKKAIQGKMRGLHSFLFKYCLILGLIVPFIIWYFIYRNFSWPFIIFTLMIFIGSFTAEYFINRMQIKHMGEDLVETARKLMQMKKNRKTQLTIGFCGLAIWTLWYLYEIYKSSLPEVGMTEMPMFMGFMIVAIIIGLAIGLAIGLHFYHKLQRTNDEMIEQINELTREQ